MSTSPAKSSDQNYFAGFSKSSEDADHNEAVATSADGSSSACDRTIADTAPESVTNLHARATAARVAERQDEPVVRLPRAAQLPPVVGLQQTYPQLDPPNAVLMASETLAAETFAPETFAPETWGRSPLSQPPRYSLSGVKMLLIITTILPPLAFIFYAFGNWPPKMNIATLWTRSAIHDQATAPGALPRTPLSATEPQDTPVITGTNQEVQAPSLQAGRQLEGGPNKSDVAVVQPTPDLQNRTSESGTAEDRSAAMPDMSPDNEPSRHRDAQENSPSKMDNMTASTIQPIDAPPAAPAPLPQALPLPSEVQGIDAGAESEPKAQTPAIPTTTRSDSMPDTTTGQRAALQPASGPDGTTTDSRTIEGKVAAKPDVGSSSEASRREAQAGVWTYCAVDLVPLGQIAVQKAISYRTCISLGKKCAGNRRYADIQFFERPTMTSKVPLELCDTES